MGIEEILDEHLDWVPLSTADKFQKYKDKSKLFWVAVKMLVENMRQIKHFEGAEDTIKGMKRLMIWKEAEKMNKKRQIICVRHAWAAAVVAAPTLDVPLVNATPADMLRRYLWQEVARSEWILFVGFKSMIYFMLVIFDH